MTPRSTAFGLLALLVFVCAVALLLLRGASEMGSAVLESRDGAPEPAEVIAPPSEEPTSDAALQGYVLDAAGATVAGAVVRVVPLSPDRVGARGRLAWIERVLGGGEDPDLVLEAGSDGSYSVETLVPGRYGLRATAPGHASAFEVAVLGDSPVRKDLALVAERTLEGSVVEAATGSPIAGAHVLALRVPPAGAWRGAAGEDFLREPRAHGVTGPDGTFRLGGLLAGRYEIVAVAGGFARGTLYSPADARGLVLELGRGTALVGVVTDPDGIPVADAEIGVFREERTLESGARTARDGTYRVEGIAPEPRTVFVRAPGRRPFRKTGVAFALGAETRLDVVLDTGASVSGRVVDGEGRPVAGARVTLIPYSGSPPPTVATGPDGAFTGSGLPEDRLLVRVEKEGYGRVERAEVRAGQRDLELVLLRTGRLRVRVTSAAAGGPVTTYRVKAWRQDANVGLSVRDRLSAPWRRVADARDGAHEVPDLTPGNYTVEVEARGHGPRRVENVAVPAGGVSDVVEIELETGATLVGRVVSAVDDAPVAGATVAVNVLFMGSPISRTDRTATTDADGAFRLEDLTPGEVSLTVSHPDHAGHVQVAGTGDPARVVLRLPVAASVHGTVYDEFGRPVPAARIVARPLSAMLLTVTADTGSDGRYRIDRLPPGAAMLIWQIDATNARHRLKQITLEPGGDHEVDFHAGGEGAELAGIVRDEEGPVAGAIVALLPMNAEGETGPSLRTDRTGEDGRFRLRGLVAGRYLLTVASGTGGPRTTEIVEVPTGGSITHELRLHAGSISGRVLGADGRPVGDATVLVVRGDPPADAAPADLVRALAGQALSAPDGTFRVPGLPDGRYVVRAGHEAHAAGRTGEILLAGGESVEGVEIRLPAAGALVLRVSGPDGPVDAVVVLALDARGRSPSLVPRERAGKDGRVAVPALAPGVWRIEVGAEGLAPAALDGVRVPERGVAEVAVRLVRGGRLRVTVVDGDGRPVAGATLRVEPLDGAPPARLVAASALLRAGLVTAADGTAVLDHVPPGRFRVHASRDGAEAAGEVALEDRAESELRIVLPR